jgi:hypothetical protein
MTSSKAAIPKTNYHNGVRRRLPGCITFHGELIVIKHSWLFVGVVALALACGKKEAVGKRAPTRPGEMHVNVETSGRIEVDGQETSLDSLKAAPARQKAAGKGVFYTRQPPTGAPTPEQWIVFVTVQDAQLPIRFEGDTQAMAPPKTP